MRRSTIRTAAVVSAVALAAVGLSACSNGSTGQSKDKSLEIFSYWTSGSEEAALKELLNLYGEQNAGVEVTNGAVSGGGGSNAAQVLQSRIAGNDAPDTWQTHPGDAMTVYTKGGLVQDLSSIYKEEKWNDVMPRSVLDSMSVDGKVYGVIAGTHRINVLWYSTPILQKLGVTVGDKLSWDDLVNGMKAADGADITPICLGDKDIFASAEIAETSILAQLGPDDWKQLTTGKLGWDDPRIATAMENYGTVLDNANSDHTALTWDQGVAQFAAGKCAFLPVVDSGYGELTKAGAVDGTDFGYVPFPGTDGSFLNVADAFVVNAKLGDSANADNWIKLLGSAEGQLAFNKIKGSTPVRSDVDVSSLGAYQQAAAASYRQDAIVDSIVFAQAATPAQQQTFYDAITAFNNNRDIKAFVTAMTAAFQ